MERHTTNQSFRYSSPVATASDAWLSCRRLYAAFRAQAVLPRKPLPGHVGLLCIGPNVQIPHSLEQVVTTLYQAAPSVGRNDGKAKHREGTREDLIESEVSTPQFSCISHCSRRWLLQALFCHSSDSARKFLQQWQESWSKYQNRKGHWFARFANNYGAGCTTWPWAIPPALMVLWGVCWCYFDRVHEQNVDEDVSGFWPEGSLPQNETGKRRLYTLPISLVLMRLRSRNRQRRALGVIPLRPLCQLSSSQSTRYISAPTSAERFCGAVDACSQ